jgi:hypothetical protein
MHNRAREKRSAQAGRDAVEEQEDAESADGNSANRIDHILRTEGL